MYHVAKLNAMAFSDNAELIWQEHAQVRTGLLRAGATVPSRPSPTFEDVIRIHRRMQAAGLVPPTTGVMN